MSSNMPTEAHLSDEEWRRAVVLVSTARVSRAEAQLAELKAREAARGAEAFLAELARSRGLSGRLELLMDVGILRALADGA